MRTKEQYYEDTLKNRAVLKQEDVLRCTCALMCAANGTAAAVNVWRCTVITPAICLAACSRCCGIK